MSPVGYDWLQNEFGAYDLYYLDPLVIKGPSVGRIATLNRTMASLKRFWPGRKNVAPPWHKADTKDLDELLTKIRKILDIDETNRDIGQFFEGGIQGKLLADRCKQKEIVDLFMAELGDSKPIHARRKFERVQELIEKKEDVEALPNCNTSECLVVIDGMINRTDTDRHPELYNSVVVSSRSEDRRVRLVRFCLADRPWPLLSMGNCGIGLMVDLKGLSKAYPNDSTVETLIDVVGLDDWYPFAKVIGYWRSDRGGRPFVDVLAILVKTYPSMGEILKCRNGPDRKFVLMLNETIEAVEAETAALSTGKIYDAGNSDLPLLYPYLLETLCLHLNNTDWTQFGPLPKGRYEPAWQYRNALKKLVSKITKQKTESRLPALFDRTRDQKPKLLPE